MANDNVNKAGSEQEQQEEMIKCPGCEFRLSKDNLPAQIAHMDKVHPKIIATRLKRAGP